MTEKNDAAGHLTRETLAGLLAGELHADESELAACHLAQCEICAGLLADAAAAMDGPAPPAGMAEIISLRAKSARGERRELAWYSLRVFAAAAAAIVILFAGSLAGRETKWSLADLHSAEPFSFMQEVGRELQSFSNRILTQNEEGG